MSQPIPTPQVQPAVASSSYGKLDLLHKGLYPGIAIAISAAGLFFGIYAFWSNNDSKRQIEELNMHLRQVQEQQEAAKKESQKQVALAEEHAQFMRVAVCRKLLVFRNISNSPSEEKAAPWIKSNYSLLQGTMMLRDYERLGEDRTKELWRKAAEDAKTLKVDDVIW